MSSPEFALELSESARTDFRDILSYTLQTWGDRQVTSYKEIIDGALKAIAADPDKGRWRIGSPFQFARAGRHLIFYRVVGGRVFVARILHAQMDIDVRLDEVG